MAPEDGTASHPSGDVVARAAEPEAARRKAADADSEPAAERRERRDLVAQLQQASAAHARQLEVLVAGRGR